MRIGTKLIRFLLMLICIILPLSFPVGCNKTSTPNHFSQLLSLLPASAKDRGGFILIDYEKFFQDIGVSFDITGDTEMNREELKIIMEEKRAQGQNEILFPIVLGSYYTGHEQYILTSPITIENVGYDFSFDKAEIQNISSSRLNNSSFEEWRFSQDRLIAAVGQYNAKTTGEALINQSKWLTEVKERYLTENYNGIAIHNWGSSENNLFESLAPPNLDILGRVSPFAINKDTLLIANSVNDVKTMIDASQNKTPSLANVPEYALAAKALNELGAYVSIIADESLANSYPYTNLHDKGLLLKKFLTCSTGYGKDEKGGYIALVLVHDNDSSAFANIELLKKRISSSLFPKFESFGEATWVQGSAIISSSEIYVEGKVLMAKLYTQEDNLWYDWFSERGSLTLHEK
jgi:hypothetical protein